MPDEKYVPGDLISTSPYTGIRPKLRYRRITQGAGIPLFDRPIKPGQFFQAYPEEIPPKLAHHFECVDSKELQELAKKREEIVEEEITEVIKGKTRKRTVRTVKTISKTEDLYEVLLLEGTRTYNVSNKVTKKVMNEVPLSFEEASELCEVLNT